MYVLTKHKKKGEEGFKLFVQSLETTGPTKLKTIVEVSLLEDPLYMKWIMPNMMTWEYIMKYEEDHIQRLRRFNGSGVLQARALSGIAIRRSFLGSESLHINEDCDWTDGMRRICSYVLVDGR